MEQKDYLIIAGVVLLLAGIFGYFFLFKKGGSDFKAPVMDGSSVFVSKNKINDPRPAMIYVHNGCPCLGQPMGQVFQNLATEMQAFGSFYQMKVDQSKIEANYSPPYVAFFVAGQLITGFKAGSKADLQTFFMKLIGAIDKTSPISGGVPVPSPIPGVTPAPGGGTPTPGGGTPTPGGGTPPGGGGGGPISNIINGILGGGTPGATPGGILNNLIPNIGGGNASGILNNVVKAVGPVANEVITNLSAADIKNIMSIATSFDPSGISGSITSAIPDSMIDMVRNWLIGMTKAQSLFIN
jgi:hypothetical protein